METATLFVCAAKEHEQLHLWAVAALDTLLEAFSQMYTKKRRKMYRSRWIMQQLTQT